MLSAAIGGAVRRRKGCLQRLERIFSSEQWAKSGATLRMRGAAAVFPIGGSILVVRKGRYRRDERPILVLVVKVSKPLPSSQRDCNRIVPKQLISTKRRPDGLESLQSGRAPRPNGPEGGGLEIRLSASPFHPPFAVLPSKTHIFFMIYSSSAPAT
jgi:hypothetical protein